VGSEETKIIDKHDYKELLELYKTAQTVPMIKMTSDPMEKDLSTQAWDKVREKMDDLGRKYNYNPKEYGVMTGGKLRRITNNEMV
jgi:hypothetical protein